MYMQKTLRREAVFSGIGLHSGMPRRAVIKPAAAGSGIVFVRSDRKGENEIPAVREYLRDTTLATTLARGEACIAMVEHLLAALMGLGIDNARIEVDGPELPVMDGSAVAYVNLLRTGGVRIQSEPRHFLRIKRPVVVEEGDKRIEIRPSNVAILDCTIDFETKAIGRQHYRWKVNEASFERHVAPARTFGFLEQVDMIQQLGLALGASLDNSIVISGDEVVNDDDMRFPDEYARHKVLDMLGDLALLGMPFLGEVISYKTGHDLNQRLVQRLLDSPRSWEVVERTPANPLQPVREPLGIPAHNRSVRAAIR